MERPTEVRPCGECTMCCKLLNIRKCGNGGLADFPFDKPAGATCKHCHPGHGCRIFGTPEFPNLCKSYFCLWKVERDIPEDARPDKVHAIFNQEEPLPEFPRQRIISVQVDPDREINKQFIRFLEHGADVGLSFLLCGGGYGFAITNIPGLAKALEARERADK